MTSVAALALCAGFTSCSHDEFEPYSQSEIVQKNYEVAFVSAFGQPASSQTWGFGQALATRANAGETYPATHEYEDADGNVIAGANMNHNQWGSTDLQSNPYGGWIVPDPLTEGQKLRVQKYFESHPNLGYQDPHFRHFFVQQVYTGGTDKTVATGNKEQNKAANGTVYTGANLNQLTVGVANSHINDFNAGTCSKSNVLNHEGKTQEDQITLMVNVYDTSCFGYHETGGSNVPDGIQHNDKMALASAADIDEWGDAQGIGEKVDDKWHRSFMGFDYELLPESAVITDTYVKLNQVQNINNIPYATYQGEVMKIGQKPAGEPKADKDITNNFIATSNDAKIEKNADGNLVWNGKYITVNVNAVATGYTKLVIEYAQSTPSSYNLSISTDGGYLEGNNYQNGQSGETIVECGLNNVNKITNVTFMNGNGNFVIKKIYLTNEKFYDSEYLLAGTEMIPFYSANTNMYGGKDTTLVAANFTKTVNGKTCLDLDAIKDLYDKGYRPYDTALWHWVKYVPVSDGYYSDWIVTLTEAKRNIPDEKYDIRVIGEDLSAGGEKSDFDFNDVVFDVKFGANAKINLLAAGGTLPLCISVSEGSQPTASEAENWEVHNLFKVAVDYMVNTNAQLKGLKGNDRSMKAVELPLGIPVANAAEANSKIKVYVKKSGEWVELKAIKGKAASKVAVGTDYDWCDEREDVDAKYFGSDDTRFTKYVGGQYYWNTWYKK